MKKTLKKTLQLAGFELKKIERHDEHLYHAVYNKDSIKQRKFYNISAGGHFGFGCGIKHPCWTNIDVDRHWADGTNFNPDTDIAYDPMLKQDLPVEPSSAELVYSRISIEHLTDEAALHLFKEIKRALRTDGVFRVATPNIDLDYRAFLNNDMHYFYWLENLNSVSIEQAFLSHFASHASTLNPECPAEKITDEEFRDVLKTMSYAEALDYCSSKCSLEYQMKERQHHINWWNKEKLERMLKEAGFKDICISSPGQSISPVMRNDYYFDNVYNKVMIYAEVIKN